MATVAQPAATAAAADCARPGHLSIAHGALNQVPILKSTKNITAAAANHVAQGYQAYQHSSLLAAALPSPPPSLPSPACTYYGTAHPVNGYVKTTDNLQIYFEVHGLEPGM